MRVGDGVPEQPAVSEPCWGKEVLLWSLHTQGPLPPLLGCVHKWGFIFWEFLPVPGIPGCLVCATSCSWLVGVPDDPGGKRTPRAQLQCWGLRGQGCANVLFTVLSLFPPSRLRIVNNTLPKISLRSLPGFGHQVDFSTQLLVESRYGLAIRGMAWGRGATSLWKEDGQQDS